MGAGLYTKEYFGKGRYEIFNCNSYSHSVPLVDKKPQSAGFEYAGKVLKVGRNSISMDIANAYDNSLKELLVTYTTKDKNVHLEYSCLGDCKEITFRFISDLKPKMRNGGLWIEDMKISCDQVIIPTISTEKYYPHAPDRVNERMKKSTAFIVEYTFRVQEKNTVSFDFDFCD